MCYNQPSVCTKCGVCRLLPCTRVLMSLEFSIFGSFSIDFLLHVYIPALRSPVETVCHTLCE